VDNIEISVSPTPIIIGVVTIGGEPAKGVYINEGGDFTYTDSEGRYVLPVDADLGDQILITVGSFGNINMPRYPAKLYDIMRRFYNIPPTVP